jgi:anthranilate synthase component 1
MKTHCPDEFAALTKTHNVIPMVREQLADQKTPISMANKLRQHGRFFLLESVEGGETWGRFSILGVDVRKEFIVNADQAVLRTDAGETVLPGNPVDALQAYLKDFTTVQVPGLPRFFGGAVGYFSFETVRFFERCGTVKSFDAPFPDAYFMIADQLVVFDNINHTLKIVCCVHPRDFDSVAAAYEHGCARLDAMEELLAQPAPPAKAVADDTGAIDMQSNMEQHDYEAMVDKARRYIVDGDIIQVVLAQHFSTDIDADAFDIYRALRYINPSPYMYFLQLDDERAIAGSSPEVMVRVTDNHAAVRPIAGTRPRGSDDAEDQALAVELLADPKEIAEHVMLVDLARNDLGRIAPVGSVTVREYMVVEKYSHVMHIVSHVDSEVLPGRDAVRGAEGARHGNHQRARTRSPRPVWRRPRIYFVWRQRHGHGDHHPHRRQTRVHGNRHRRRRHRLRQCAGERISRNPAQEPRHAPRPGTGGPRAQYRHEPG